MLEQKFLGPLDSDNADRDLTNQAIRDCFNLVPQIGGRGNSPRRENLKGSTLIPFTLPEGTNKTVGRFKDKNNGQIFYFNQNSNDNDGVYVSDGNSVQKVLEMDLGFTEETVVSGAGIIDKTLTWTDGVNPIRAIDFERGINTFSASNSNIKEWEIVTDRNNLVFGENPIVTVSSSVSGDSVYVLSAPVDEDDIDNKIDFWVTQLSANNEIVVERCGDNISIKESGSSDITEITAQAYVEVAAINHYILPLTEREINLINRPPNCEPTFVFLDDSSRKTNLLKNKQFQFRSRYVYYDNTKSTLSPISDLAFNRSCGGGDNSGNCLEITFNDSAYNQREVTLVKNVEIYFREGNAGTWYLADSLSRSEYLYGKYNFCNDGVYRALDDETAGKNFDSTPLTANALGVLKNRVFVAGTTEGYDTPCIEADVDVDISDFDPTATENTWTIEGYMRITNPFQSNRDYGNSQPIYVRTDENGGANVYGGFGVSEVVGSVNNVGSKYNQYIPQGGFTVYLAGTQYRATSKQIYDKDGGNNDLSTAPSVGDGIYDLTASGNRVDVRNNLVDAGRKVYQKFSISGVKPGRYVLRVASHLCYEGATPSYISDASGFYRIDNTLKFQQTSTNISVMQESVSNPTDFQTNTPSDDHASSTRNGSDYFEIVLELGLDGGTHTIDDRVICIHDLSDPTFADVARASTFYTRDIDVNTRSTDIDKSVSVERANVKVKEFDFLEGIYNLKKSVNDLYTDHNGYSYYSSAGTVFAGTAVIRPEIYSGENEMKEFGDKSLLRGYNLSSLFDGTAAAEVDPKSDLSSLGVTEEFIALAINGNTRDSSRTLVRGTVNSNGEPLTGMLVVMNGTNKYDITDSTGSFEILGFSDSDGSGATTRRNTTLFIGAADSPCIVDPDPLSASRKDVFIVSPLRSGSSNYNNTNFYDFNSPLVYAFDNIVNLATNTVLKRGGTFDFGVVYMDDYNRSSLVATDPTLKKYIPYYTEDLGLSIPNLYDSITFRYGDPIVSWEIRNKAPEWATRYKWVRTKNTTQSDYLSWLVNSVTYVINYSPSSVKDEIISAEDIVDTTYSNGDANEIHLNLDNIVTYNGNNPNSKLGYQFRDGDRCIITKIDGEYATEYFDLPIKGKLFNSIVIEAVGTLPELTGNIEIQTYSPRPQTDEQIYYEMGKCYLIENGFHYGDDGLQTDVTPATGTFTTGDTYRIGRSINTGVDIYVDTTATDKEYGGVSQVLQDHHSIADFIDTKDQSIGRINIENKDAKQEYFFSGIRFSNQFVQETQINGIRTFDFNDFESLPNERGVIRSLVATRNNLLAIHETESTSVYIGEQFISSPDGAGTLSQTDKVIGDENLLRGGFGTINPESVTEWNDNVFFWDATKAEPIMYSINGLEPIGTARANRNRFLEIQKGRNEHLLANPSDYSRVHGGYDPERKIFIMSFSDMGEHSGVTIGFNDDYNYWSTRFGYKPEAIVDLVNNMYAFKDGQLWKMNDDENNYNTFFGVTYPSSFKIVANASSDFEKIFRSIGLNSNKLFDVSSISNREGQLSTLKKQHFVQRDDMYYADILRDKNTNVDKLTGNQVPLFHGDIMRSQVMEFEFTSDEAGQIFVEYIVVDTQESPGHLLGKRR